MSERDTLLARIADALERLAPAPSAETDWLAHPAYIWDGGQARGVEAIEAPALDQLLGIDRQKATVSENIARLAAGAAAHDMLLWGARGMGKSALMRASVIASQTEEPAQIALVQIGSDALSGLPALFEALRGVKRNFLVFIDDIGFGEDDASGPRRLRSWLEGGVEARPANVRLAVTSNHRAIQPRDASQQGNPLAQRDVVDDALALADRFGLSLGFHACDQAQYLAIVAAYADPLDLAWEEADALEWAKRRGARSGRVAWHYVTELAGRAGKQL